MADQTGNAANFTLTPVALIPTTVKTQTAFACAIAVTIILATVGGSVFFGFLHEDYPLLRAIGSHAMRIESILADPVITHFGLGPIATTLFFAQHAGWGTNAFWYHALNIALYSTCAVLVALITALLSGLNGNRLSSALSIWAAILFTLYPLHADIVNWVYGQTELVFSTAYLATIFFYLRLRTSRERYLLPLCMLSFLAAVLSKTAALFLPVLIVLAEPLLFSETDKRPLAQRLIIPALLFMLFGFSFTIGMIAPGLFASHSLSETLSSWWEVCTTSGAWLTLLLPVNGSDWWPLALTASYAVIGVSVVCRAFWRSAPLKLLLWLTLFTILSMVPDPNIASERFPLSRVLFTPSAALSIFLAFAALPGADAISKSRAKLTTFAGLTALIILSSVLALSLNATVKNWSSASLHLQNLVEKLQLTAMNLTPDRKIVIANVPEDMGDRVEITSAVTPPFQRFQLRNELILFPGRKGNKDSFLWSDNFLKTLNTQNIGMVLVWNDQSQRLTPWDAAVGGERFHLDFNKQTFPSLVVEPRELELNSSSTAKSLQETGSAISVLPTGLRVLPGRNTVTIWASGPEISPLKAGVAGLALDYTSDTGCKTCHNGVMKLVWEGDFGSRGDIKKITGSATISELKFGQYVVWLARYPNWTLARRITRIGVRFEPGNYYADIKSLDLLPYAWTAPRLALQQNGKVIPDGGQLIQLPAQRDAAVLFDASKVPGAKGVKVIVSQGLNSYEPTKEGDLYAVYPVTQSKPLMDGDFDNVASAVALPQTFTGAPGVYEVRATALNAEGAIIGLPSEPLRLQIIKK